LRAISEFIAKDNPRRAMTFIDELEQHCRTLAAKPRAHPVLLGQENSGVRKAVHRNYLIFYREVESTVEILHILHGARNWELLLFGKTQWMTVARRRRGVAHC
jgi:toxin ParE1/3/4